MSERARGLDPGPRVVRPDEEKGGGPATAVWLSLALAAVGLGGGYYVGARVFDPGPREDSGEENGVRSVGSTPGTRAAAAGDVRDEADAGAGASAAEPSAEPSAEPTAPAGPVVPVRVMGSLLQSCGDGEELNVPGQRCEPTPGVEVALRRQLGQLGSCEAALAGARTPNATLSLGLRVDFVRRRVTPLPGRSSSVANPLAYIACARSATEGLDALWNEPHAKARYLYFFSLRFGPLSGPLPSAVTPSAVAPSAQPSAVASARPSAEPSAVMPSARPSAVTPSVVAPSAAVAGGGPSAAPSAEATGYPVAPVSPPEPAQVVWQRVVVRDAPHTGVIVGRLPNASTVTVIARSGSWRQIRAGALTGWVFGEAIGR